MNTFYFEVQMTKPSGKRWTIGLKLEADSFTEALQLFKAWNFGVQAISYLTSRLRCIGVKATPDRSYFNMDSSKEIYAELTTFMNEGSSHGPDLNTVTTDSNDNCPF